MAVGEAPIVSPPSQMFLGIPVISVDENNIDRAIIDERMKGRTVATVVDNEWKFLEPLIA